MHTLRDPSPGAGGARRPVRGALLIVVLGAMATLLGGCVDDFGHPTPRPTDFVPISVENDTPTEVRITYRIGDTNRDVGLRGHNAFLGVTLSAGETASFDFDLGDRAGTPRCMIGTIMARTLEPYPDGWQVALIPPPVCAGAVLRLSDYSTPSP